MKIWSRKSIRRGMMGIFLSMALLSSGTGIYGAEAESCGVQEAQMCSTEDGNNEDPEWDNSRESAEEPEEPEKEQKEKQEEKTDDTIPELEPVKKETKEDEGVFYLKNDTQGVDTYSFNNSTTLPVSNVRYNKFLWSKTDIGTASCPNLGVGIKYIAGDDKNVDGGGKWRYVYCIEYRKDSPSNGLNMQFTGWSSRKIAYAMYYGAVYYGYPCRYQPYSTGDWQMDYFVTQIAIHVLNGEFTMAGVRNGLNKGSATKAEQNLAYDRINKMVNGANNTANYTGFTSDGWIDMNHASFSLNGYTNSWSLQNGRYLSGGKFHGVFNSYYGYDFREQLTGYDISIPQGVGIEKSGKQTYADFQLAIAEAQYQKWQLTGMQIPVTVTASVPRYWGAGIYKSTSATNFQNVCLLTWSGSGGTTKLQARADLNVAKVTRNLTIYKKDQETQQALSGAVFSLWAYDGSSYSQKIGDFQDMKDGSYQFKNIAYTQTKNGWFLIKEERPPENYQKEYHLQNSNDEENYRQYGGREIRMNENGFYSDRVDQPFIFLDKKEETKARVEVKKYDIRSKKLLAGAEFQVYPWVKEEESYSADAIQILTYNSQEQKYETGQTLTADASNLGKFLIRETRTPDHYCGSWQQEITVTEPGTTTLELEAYNYPERQITIYKKIRTDELVWAHGNPTFFFRISGKDMDGTEHWYQCMISFHEDMETQQEYLSGKVEVTGIPAGTYQVEELPMTARYILTDAVSEDANVRVVNTPVEKVNGIQKITSEVTADLTLEDASVMFENRKVFFDEYSHDDVQVNHLKVAEE